jgi:hypothetical protein
MDDLESTHYSAKFYGASLDETLHGVLLRRGRQISCLQPWPQLGDPSLNDLLKQLQAPPSEWHPLLKNALAVFEDPSFSVTSLHEYERAELSLPSHVLVSYESRRDEIISFLEQGFREFKIKFRPHFDPHGGVFAHFQELKNSFPIRLRLDSNSTFPSAESFLKQWHRFSGLHKEIEFVEDPVALDLLTWKRLQDEGVSIAADRPLHFLSPREVDADFPCRFLVMKPIRHRLEDWDSTLRSSGKKLVFTTALDHPWGQLWAFHSIHQLRLKGIVCETSGLFTETLQSSALNPLVASHGGVQLRGLSSFLEQTERLPWSKFSLLQI